MNRSAVLVGIAAAALSARPASGGAATEPRPGSVSATFSFDLTRGRPIEGFLSYVTIQPYVPGVRQPRGRTVHAELAGALNARGLTTRLAPGRYRLSTYQRICSGNCGSLGPPSRRCGRDIRVRTDGHPSYVIRVSFATGPNPACVIRAR